MGFASGGLMCNLGDLCFYSSSVLADSFDPKPARTQSPKTLPVIVKDDNAMTNQSNLYIKSTGRISKEFVDRNILTFNQATLFVKELTYGRNADKHNLASVFTDNCGTCSTKHALLKKLADENNFETVKLMVGLFRMNKNNTPEITETLLQNNLEFIPEAHCYLRFEDQILDLTKINSNPVDFLDDLIEEIEISPEQITDYKVLYHKNYLITWLDNNKQINLSLNEIWKIREQCIQDLANY